MFEFFGAVTEALGGFVAGYFTKDDEKFSWKKANLISSLCVIVFFCCHALDELLFDNSNQLLNHLGILILLSAILYVIILIFIFLAYWLENKLKHYKQKN